MKQTAAAAVMLAMASPAEAQGPASVAPKNMRAITPALAGYTDRVLFGDVWRRAELSPRDRSLVTLAVLIATGKTAQLGGHLGRGLTNGLKPAEVAGMVTQLAFYSGWPNAVSALNVVEQVFMDQKIDVGDLKTAGGVSAAGQDLDVARGMTVGRIIPVAPKLAELINDVVFGDLWQRTDLTPRDRSLVTIAALAAAGDTEQLGYHLRRGLGNGLTELELGEAITHVAFYAGWPKAIAAAEVAKPVFEGRSNAMSASQPTLDIVPAGASPNAAPAEYFTGSVLVTSAFKGTGAARLGGATVTFQPGAHTNWHTHPLGQLLIVTDGKGWVQVGGEPARVIKAGTPSGSLLA